MINSITRSTILTKTQYRKMSAGNPRYSDMELIATTVVGSAGASTVSFSSIPTSYKHLQVRMNVRSNAAYVVGTSFMNFNSDTGSNYATHALYTGGGGIGNYNIIPAGAINISTHVGANATANIFGNSIIDILDYQSTTKNKTARTFGGSTSEMSIASGVWINTAAITSLSFAAQSGSWVAGSRFSLYGVKG